jgi:hypothetical protein
MAIASLIALFPSPLIGTVESGRASALKPFVCDRLRPRGPSGDGAMEEWRLDCADDCTEAAFVPFGGEFERGDDRIGLELCDLLGAPVVDGVELNTTVRGIEVFNFCSCEIWIWSPSPGGATALRAGECIANIRGEFILNIGR